MAEAFFVFGVYCRLQVAYFVLINTASWKSGVGGEPSLHNKKIDWDET